MEGDRFGFILAEAGTISSSQEEILRRSSFIGNPTTPSDDDEDDEEGGAPRYRISVRPITMRSASDAYSAYPSSSASSSSSSFGSGCREAGGPPHGRHHRPAALEAEDSLEKRPDASGGEGGRGALDDSGDRPLGSSGEKRTCVAKPKRKRPLGEEATPEKDGAFVAAARTIRKRRDALSDESTQEPEVVSSSDRHPGGCGGWEPLDSPVSSPSGKLVAKRLRFGGRGAEASEGLARDGVPQASLSGDPTAGGGFAHSRRVMPGPSPSATPNERGGDTGGLRRLPPSIQNPSVGERGDRSGSADVDHRTPLVQVLKRLEGQQAPPPPRGIGPEEGPSDTRQLSDLVDLLITFAKKPTVMHESVDFLDVLAAKGIDIPPPRWWREGGYSSLVSLPFAPYPYYPLTVLLVNH